ncbi:MAG: UDP binding domain-containing protein, partial [Gemmatimonadales bacterium]
AEMLLYVVQKVAAALNDAQKSVTGSRVLLLGVAYKRDIDDLRESPALEVIQHLQELGAQVAFHDPFCAVIKDDGHTPIRGLPLHSTPLTDEALETADAVLVVTDHTTIDDVRVAARARLVVDARGVMRGVKGKARMVGLSDGRMGGAAEGRSGAPAGKAR